jgi:hypothetical protein
VLASERDPEKAKIRHAVKAAELARQWKGLSAGPRSISHKEAVAIAGEFYRRMVQRHQDDPGPPHKWAREW